MATKEPCLIGETVTISGQVSGDQDLLVQGSIEGRVALNSRLVIEPSGAVEAEVEVTETEVHGVLRGDVSASKVIHASDTARIVGTLRAPKVILAPGTRFTGEIEMDVDLPPELLASPTGGMS